MTSSRPSAREPVFHIALQRQWQDAQREGSYTWSTLGRRLADVGFIHCSHAHQVARVGTAFYADVAEPLVVLAIDASGLDVRDEPGVPTAVDAELFPHVYGPLPVSAVHEVHPAHVVDGRFVTSVG